MTAARWPDAEGLLILLGEHTGPQTRVRDGGMLCAAAARPRATILGRSVYPTVVDQAAALLHSICVWRPLEFWNSGLAWAAADLSFGLAGLALTMPAIERMRLTDELTRGEIESVDEISVRLAPYLRVLE